MHLPGLHFLRQVVLVALFLDRAKPRKPSPRGKANLETVLALKGKGKCRGLEQQRGLLISQRTTGSFASDEPRLPQRSRIEFDEKGANGPVAVLADVTADRWRAHNGCIGLIG
ncbi:hypothetical protein B0H63DRAFT_124438 [Podospora didyma]|uniref:Secreted protein n=1 Tax=Podospora didyma TaxID=330526 RepID=A0AAE0NZX6_9PEZI|nr:hypothetical protein B0H63DRAFT_124438 [Podospora didyma]